MERPEPPHGAADIRERSAEIAFGAALRLELRSLAMAQQLLAELPEPPPPGTGLARLREARLHVISAEEALRALPSGSALDTRWDALRRLRGLGRGTAERWLDDNLAAVGTRPTLDFARFARPTVEIQEGGACRNGVLRTGDGEGGAAGKGILMQAAHPLSSGRGQMVVRNLGCHIALVADHDDQDADDHGTEHQEIAPKPGQAKHIAAGQQEEDDTEGCQATGPEPQVGFDMSTGKGLGRSKGAHRHGAILPRGSAST
jgi:hypothetical protein